MNLRRKAVTQLFAEYNQKSEAEIAAAEAQKTKYSEVMAVGNEIIKNVVDDVTANAAVKAMEGLEHALTSKKELQAAWKAKTKELGLVYDKATKTYQKGVIA